MGGLMSDASLEDIELGVSICRNPHLAHIFYRLHLIEAYGTGLQKIRMAYKEDTIQPKIQVSPNAFKLVLPNRNAVRVERATQMKVQEPTAIFYLEESERKILDYLKTHGRIKKRDVMELAGVSSATASRLLQRMVKKGILRVQGKARATFYTEK